MALPKVGHPTATVTVGGHHLSVRGLTRGENARVSEHIEKGQVEKAEVYVLACATDTPIDDAFDWYENTSSAVVQELLDVVGSLTRRSEEESKSGEAPVHEG